MGSISGRIIFLWPYETPGQLHYLALSQKGILNLIVFEFLAIFNTKVELFAFNRNNGFSAFCHTCMMFDWCDLVAFFPHEKHENVFPAKRQISFAKNIVSTFGEYCYPM